MSFQHDVLHRYYSNDLIYPQHFAKYSFANEKLGQDAYEIILSNKDFSEGTILNPKTQGKFKLYDLLSKPIKFIQFLFNSIQNHLGLVEW